MSRKRFEVFIRVLDCFNCMTQAALITLIHLLGNSTEGRSAYIYNPLGPDFGCRRAMLEYRVVSDDVGNISRPGRIGGGADIPTIDFMIFLIKAKEKRKKICSK